jgi:Peptidase family M1 domain
VTGLRGAVAVAACAVVLSGCTPLASTLRRAAAPPAAAPSAAAPSCPAARARPDPARPRVDLDMRLSDDLHTVTGTETVRFTPDRPVTELVFRLVPNGPGSAVAGNRLTVDASSGPDVAGSSYDAAGAAAPGGLHRVHLRSRLPAGRTTTVTLAWTLTLGHGAFDRVGTDDGASGPVAWWGSGAPLLAWEPGVGWAEEPFTPVLGETATSPAAETTVRVSAPAGLTLLMTGRQAAPTSEEGGRRTWTSTDPATRDVSVAAGRLTTRSVTTAGGTAVTVGVLPGASVPDAATLADWTTAAIGALEARFGPYGFGSLTVAALPAYGVGIEYPGSILLAAPSRQVLVHEVAHMWFYGMVGDDQYRDPWLDEAFATYAEALVDDHASPEGTRRALDLPGEVGAPIGSFAGFDDYARVVYGKGGAALLAARAAAGPAAFDAALRCYVDARAWTIARPRDVAAALARLRPALDVLVQAGALRPADVPR